MITETELVLDKIDLNILRLMQENARISNADMARELGMAWNLVNMEVWVRQQIGLD